MILGRFMRTSFRSPIQNTLAYKVLQFKWTLFVCTFFGNICRYFYREEFIGWKRAALCLHPRLKASQIHALHAFIHLAGISIKYCLLAVCVHDSNF